MSVIGSACSELRNPSSATLSGEMNTACARSRVAASDLASCDKASARRLAATAPGPCWVPMTWVSVSTPLLSAVTISASVGCGWGVCPKVGPSALAACPTACSFCG